MDLCTQYLDPDSLHLDLKGWYMDLNTMGDQKKRVNPFTPCQKRLHDTINNISYFRILIASNKGMAKYLVTCCAYFIGSHPSEVLLNTGNQTIETYNMDPFYPGAIQSINLSISLATSREVRC
jgi:hypothetical protein